MGNQSPAGSGISAASALCGLDPRCIGSRGAGRCGANEEGRCHRQQQRSDDVPRRDGAPNRRTIKRRARPLRLDASGIVIDIGFEFRANLHVVIKPALRQPLQSALGRATEQLSEPCGLESSRNRALTAPRICQRPTLTLTALTVTSGDRASTHQPRHISNSAPSPRKELTNP